MTCTNARCEFLGRSKSNQQREYEVHFLSETFPITYCAYPVFLSEIKGRISPARKISTSSQLIMEQRLSTTKHLEEMLGRNGYAYSIPSATHSFSSGDGDLMEFAPLGYYRFHFWKNSKTPKEHKNYLGVDRTLGHFCISLLQESQWQRRYYRLLIRTQLNTKSCIVTQEAIASLGVEETNKAVVGIALSNYIFDEKRRRSIPGDADDASSLFSSGAVSLRSEMSARTGFLPHSRLRELSKKTEVDLLTLHPLLLNEKLSLHSDDGADETVLSYGKNGGSLVSLSGPDFSELDRIPLQALLSNLTSANGIEICNALLDLEESFFPDCYEFDVFRLNRQCEEEWVLFCSFLGTKTGAKETALQTDIVCGKDEACRFSEFISSEKSYHERLVHILSDYKEPLEREYKQRGVNTAQLQKAFSGLVRIEQDISRFVSLLSRIRLGTSEAARDFADALVASISYKTYASFVLNRNEGNAALTALLESHPFAARHCEERRLQAEHHLDIAALLAEPVQRTMRYDLLLQKMLFSGEDDKAHIHRAREHVRAILDEIEANDKEIESVAALFRLARTVDGVPDDVLDGKKRLLTTTRAFNVTSVARREIDLVLLSDRVLLVDSKKTCVVFQCMATALDCHYRERDSSKDRQSIVLAARDSAFPQILLAKDDGDFCVFMRLFLAAKERLAPPQEKRTHTHTGTRLTFNIDPPHGTTPVPILFCNEVTDAILEAHDANAIAIVQATDKSFRIIVKTKTEIYCNSQYCILPTKFLYLHETTPTGESLESLFDALLNYRRLCSAYPPFEQSLLARSQKMLAGLVRSFIKKNTSFFSALKKTIRKTAELNLTTEKNTLWRDSDETDILKNELIFKVAAHLLPATQEYLLVEMTCHIALYIENAVTDSPNAYLRLAPGNKAHAIYEKTICRKTQDVLKSLGTNTESCLCAFVLLVLDALSTEMLPKHALARSLKDKVLFTHYKYTRFALFLFAHFKRISMKNGIDLTELAECLFAHLLEAQKAKKTSERSRIIRANREVLLRLIRDALEDPARIAGATS
eukprot:GHVN01098663.1.p1 GENE.GHVN01098663.1~~GHVN01098663.1.p1  ORF type:complete len:1044 (-),score=78.17 GHVN01098663.1:3087-6218(-)